MAKYEHAGDRGQAAAASATRDELKALLRAVLERSSDMEGPDRSASDRARALYLRGRLVECTADHGDADDAKALLGAEEALKKAAQWEVEKVAPTPRPRGAVAATPRGGHSALARVAPTPAHLRAPRAGETIMSVNGSPLAAVPMSTAKLAATIKVKGPKSKLPGAAADRPALLVELPSADGCVALNDSETLASLRSDPTMTADAMAHLTALQGEISKVMKTLQTAK